MSFEEKGTWAYTIVVLFVSAIYFTRVLGQVSDVPISEINYQSSLIWAIVLTIVATIIGYIVIAISAPGEADKKDQRDTEINRFGQSFGYSVVGVLSLIPLALAMAEFEQFWIANVIFAIGVIGGTIVSIVKIYAYRRGF